MSRSLLQIPVLPLPDVVLFPRTVLPLHIFEPRYKQLVSDALRKEGELGLTLLQPGWELNYYESPEVFRMGSLGVISEHEKRSRGEFNILLRGLRRFAIEDFLHLQPYRVARVRLLDDVAPHLSQANRLSKELVRYFREIELVADPHSRAFKTLADLDFQTLVNTVCAALNVSVYQKQELLELQNINTRGEAALKILKTQVTNARLISRFRHLEPQDARDN